MKPQLTHEQLKKILPSCKDPMLWANLLNEYLPKYNINTPERVACFIAQCGHESGHFNRLVENLNYSSDGLLKTFPKYFKTKAEADKYARKPEMIANKVYANRLGNGDEASGDGWKYRGRGFIQCTGRANYEKFDKWFNDDKVFIAFPEKLEKPDFAILSAIWYWTTNDLNLICDKDNIWATLWKGKKVNKFEWLTIKINGALHGYDSRLEIYERAKKVLIEQN